MTTIAILGGTGHEGSALARRWAGAGCYQVVIGSRDPARAARVADRLSLELPGPPIRSAGNEAAALAADVCVLTVPYAAHRQMLTDLRPVLGGKLLVDVTVRVPAHGAEAPRGPSAAEEAQALLGSGVRVVAAFQTVSAWHLGHGGAAIEGDVLVSGDDPEAKAEVITLAERIGMRGVDVGPLARAATVEGLTAILIDLNRRYGVKAAGIRITGLF